MLVKGQFRSSQRKTPINPMRELFKLCIMLPTNTWNLKDYFNSIKAEGNFSLDWNGTTSILVDFYFIQT